MTPMSIELRIVGWHMLWGCLLHFMATYGWTAPFAVRLPYRCLLSLPHDAPSLIGGHHYFLSLPVKFIRVIISHDSWSTQRCGCLIILWCFHTFHTFHANVNWISGWRSSCMNGKKGRWCLGVVVVPLWHFIRGITEDAHNETKGYSMVKHLNQM